MGFEFNRISLRFQRNKTCFFASIILASFVSSLILKQLTAPFAWISLIFFLFAVWGIILSKKTTFRAIWLNIAVLILTLGVCELYFYKTRDKSNEFVLEGGYTEGYFVEHDLLGYAPAKSISVSSQKSFKDKLIYDVVYTINPQGLRISPPFNENSETVLFFGGSFTFGEGVNDHQTIPFLVGSRSAGKYRTYNFGFHGYGPHQMLASFENDLVASIVDHEPAHVIYLFGTFHVARAAGLAGWDKHGPRYILEKDWDVVFAGHFDDNKSPYLNNILVETVLDYLEKSMILKKTVFSYLNPDNYLNVSDEHINLFISIVDKTRKFIYQHYPDCKFHTVIWDKGYKDEGKEICKTLIEGFKVLEISVHLISDILPGYKNSIKYSINPRDHHPNPIANEMICDYIIKNILTADVAH